MTEGTTPTSIPKSSRSRSGRLAAGIAGLALGLTLVGAGPAVAQTEGDVERRTDRERTTTDVRPERAPAERPERPERPERDLEVLRLACGIADGDGDTVTDDATRVHIGCRWRAATGERAAGYQLWRIVDRGERELVARGGLDLLGARDVVPADVHVVRYAVIAVDENGRRVGQSRVQWVDLDDGADDRDEHDRRLAARARSHRSISG